MPRENRAVQWSLVERAIASEGSSATRALNFSRSSELTAFIAGWNFAFIDSYFRRRGWKLSHARFPFIGIASRMEDGKHLNFITHDFIEHCERESANNSASEVPINKREEMRIIDDMQQGIVYTFA
jgi:hypothetical protein